MNDFTGSATTLNLPNAAYTITYQNGASILGSQEFMMYNDTPSGTKVSTKLLKDEKGISPSLYFKFVKSKLTKVQQQKLQHRLKKLKKLVAQASDLGQQAAYEEYSKLLVATVRESEAFAIGIDTWLHKSVVQKFLHSVKENSVKMGLLSSFPRVMPAVVAKKIKSVQSRNVFDEIWILYTDYTEEIIKTNKEKIRDKDPIAFGVLKTAPDVLYFITDWVDEYCDLTLNKFVEKVRVEDPDFAPSHIPEIDDKMLEVIKNEVKARMDRLNDTKPSNFRSLMAEEDKKPAKKGFWARLFGK